MKITVEVPIEYGEIIAHALDRAVEAGDVATGAELGCESWHAQQADALVAVATAYLAGGTEMSTSVADHYQVVVHVDEKSLRGGVAGRSDLAIETVKRLTCDGSVIRVVEDDQGNPLDIGRKQRTVSTSLKRALWARDRGCTFPGCHRKRFVDAHHIDHWTEGGATSAENLTLLCTYHHRLLHEGGFNIRRDEHGAPYFQRPDGRAIPRGGYRAEDMNDHGLPVPDGWLAALFNSKNPSAEVRDARGRYFL